MKEYSVNDYYFMCGSLVYDEQELRDLLYYMTNNNDEMKELFNQELHDCYGFDELFGYRYAIGEVLEKVDSVKYRILLTDFIDDYNDRAVEECKSFGVVEHQVTPEIRLLDVTDEEDRLLIVDYVIKQYSLFMDSDLINQEEKINRLVDKFVREFKGVI